MRSLRLPYLHTRVVSCTPRPTYVSRVRGACCFWCSCFPPLYLPICNLSNAVTSVVLYDLLSMNFAEHILCESQHPVSQTPRRSAPAALDALSLTSPLRFSYPLRPSPVLFPGNTLLSLSPAFSPELRAEARFSFLSCLRARFPFPSCLRARFARPSPAQPSPARWFMADLSQHTRRAEAATRDEAPASLPNVHTWLKTAQGTAPVKREGDVVVGTAMAAAVEEARATASCRAVYILTFLTMMATQAVDPVVVLYLTSRGWATTGNASLYASCVAGARLAPVLLSPLLGVLMQRCGAVVTVLASCCLAIAALALMTVVQHPMAFAAGYVLAVGVQTAERSTVHQACVAAASPARGRIRAMAWSPLATSLGGLLGPVLILACATADEPTTACVELGGVANEATWTSDMRQGM